MEFLVPGLGAEKSSRAGDPQDITVQVTRLGDFYISPAKACSRHISVSMSKTTDDWWYG